MLIQKHFFSYLRCLDEKGDVKHQLCFRQRRVKVLKGRQINVNSLFNIPSKCIYCSTRFGRRFRAPDQTAVQPAVHLYFTSAGLVR